MSGRTRTHTHARVWLVNICVVVELMYKCNLFMDSVGGKICLCRPDLENRNFNRELEIKINF
jgi:hypothetical protein